MFSVGNKRSGEDGFTLMEVVMTLVIMGFITLSIGVGMVYAVHLYQETRGTETVIPQANVAANVIRRLAERGGQKALKQRLRYVSREAALYLDKTLLLEGVTTFAVMPSVSVFDGRGRLLQVAFTVRTGRPGSRTHDYLIEVVAE